ncbi:fam11a b protein [Anaeramoeba ignava]|uniref:Fam11a b protein n=1 Tax=Anaeramoeba ignava TaxID=1746090 RepID=A0A9Q0RA68_ANAIG|nr:fam11a b protein [Anaeramoeba ignava]
MQNKLPYIIFENKGVVQITDNFYNSIFYSAKQETTEKTQNPPNEEENLISKLPEEIIYSIANYLSPVEVLLFGQVCSAFYDISNDDSLWRNISKQFNQLFVCDPIQVKMVLLDEVYQYEVIGFQTNLKEKIKKIQNKILKNSNEIELKSRKNANFADEINAFDQNLSQSLNADLYFNSNLNHKEEEKKDQQKKYEENEENPRQKNQRGGFFSVFLPKGTNNNDDGTTTLIDGKTVAVEINEEKTINEYLDHISNPKKKFLKKIKELKPQMEAKKAEENEQQNLERRRLKFTKIEDSLGFSALSFTSLWIVGLCISVIMIYLKIHYQFSISYGSIFMSSWIPLGIVGLLVLLFGVLDNPNRTSTRSDECGISITWAIFVWGFGLQFALIGLKMDAKISSNWFTVFSPFFVFWGLMVLGFLGVQCDGGFSGRFSCLNFFFEFIWVVLLNLFLYFLAAKLNHSSNWNYAKVFSPLYILYSIPILGLIRGFFRGISSDFFLLSFGFFCLFLPLIIFQILLNLYLDGSSISLSSVFIPLWILFSFLIFLGLIGFGLSLLKSIQSFKFWLKI